MGLNFTLTTTFGDLDLLGEVTGIADTSNCCRNLMKSLPLAFGVGGQISSR